MTIGRRPCLGALALIACLCVAPVALADGAIISESQVKAAFLYNFTKFVTWPDEAFSGERDPIVIGVFEDGILAAELRSIVDGRKVNGRAIDVRVIATADEARGAQVLFVSADADDTYAGFHDSLEGVPVLTVGESPAFAAAEGSITFTQQDAKLRFEINMTAAERSRLKISAQLQGLATAVRRSP
jgi:hypothetical protein